MRRLWTRSSVGRVTVTRVSHEGAVWSVGMALQMLRNHGVLRTITVGWRTRARSVVVVVGTAIIVPGVLMLKYAAMMLIPEEDVVYIA